ncbi:WhiB family transcriptional regulator [Streptomyces syringium]|uniref:WhiB family transcriptional regulator n=1 Tax=Streptomyces syringium TaxID=76729 RepID=UPI0034522C79
MGKLTPRRTQGWDLAWRQHGACTHVEADAVFFARKGASHEEAIDLCRLCKVRTECLAYALDERIPDGVFGGTTAQWRSDLIARRPHVTSWRVLLEHARTEHYRKYAPRHPRPRRPTTAGSADRARHPNTRQVSATR